MTARSRRHESGHVTRGAWWAQADRAETHGCAPRTAVHRAHTGPAPSRRGSPRTPTHGARGAGGPARGPRACRQQQPAAGAAAITPPPVPGHPQPARPPPTGAAAAQARLNPAGAQQAQAASWRTGVAGRGCLCFGAGVLCGRTGRAGEKVVVSSIFTASACSRCAAPGQCCARPPGPEPGSQGRMTLVSLPSHWSSERGAGRVMRGSSHAAGRQSPAAIARPPRLRPDTLPPCRSPALGPVGESRRGNV